jgi:hypothetical protein
MNNDAAFPCVDFKANNGNGGYHLGMTKREYMATQFMAAFISGATAAGEDVVYVGQCAPLYVSLVDKLLEELENGKAS